MRVLVIGGTGFIGPHVVRVLCGGGHDIAVFNRGLSAESPPPGVTQITGDRTRLHEFAAAFRSFAPDVVLDMAPMNQRDAEAVVRTFRGLAWRAVAVSSVDVYRAYGIIHRLESGPLEPVPIGEDAPLRSAFFPYRGKLEGADEYEKILVERAFQAEPDLPATILRLGAIHGPGDTQHRLFSELKRMDDDRPFILLEERSAIWRWTRGYVEDIAHAIALAATDDRAAGRVYNVGEQSALSGAEWVRLLADAAGWNGAVVVVPDDRWPERWRAKEDLRQDLIADTARIRDELGYAEVVTSSEALRRTIAWERAHPPDQINPRRFDYAAEDALRAAL